MDGPIFILGAARSGSTLLRLILDSHERIAIGPESGFMGAVEALKRIPGWKHGPGWHTRFGVTEDEMNAQVRAFFSGFFGDYAKRQGKVRWGEKTPFHCWHIEQMAAIFPDAVFVAIVRHPAATALSASRWHHPWEESLDRWVRVNTEILRLGGMLGPQRFALCRYEDVVLHTEPTLRALVAFLDEPWSDSLLRHDEVQREKGAPRVSDGGTRPGESIDAARVSRWTTQLTVAQQEAVATIAGPLCRLLGYTLEEAISAPLAAGAWVLDGGGIAQLIDHAAGEVAFVPQPRYPVTPSGEDLGARLLKAERALARLRQRRSVRLADALKQLRRGKLRDGLRNLRAALSTSAGSDGGA